MKKSLYNRQMKKTLGRDQVVLFAKTRTLGGRVAEGERDMVSSAVDEWV